jgi:hypothetical protein
MIHYEILAPNRVGTPRTRRPAMRADRRFRFKTVIQTKLLLSSDVVANQNGSEATD